MPTDPGMQPPSDPRVREAIHEITGNWWALALRAIVAIVIGIFALARPNITLLALITLFGVYAMADGLFAVVAALRGVRTNDKWGWMLIEGIVGVAIGVYVLLNPGIGALALTWLVAAWALVTGLLEIFAGVRVRHIVSGEWLLFLAGALSVVLAIIIFANPGIGMALLVAWVGAYAIISGIVLLGVAFRVRRWSRAHSSGV